ncbi:hypothetical protein KFU94_00740 [Chloroflexi bacterium TSY]|nr:hypothetical protein [Chloroflexi bacterium TSY]
MNQEFSAAVTGFCAHVRMLSPQSETVRPIQKIKYTREGVKLALQKEQK